MRLTIHRTTVPTANDTLEIVRPVPGRYHVRDQLLPGDDEAPGAEHNLVAATPTRPGLTVEVLLAVAGDMLRVGFESRTPDPLELSAVRQVEGALMCLHELSRRRAGAGS